MVTRFALALLILLSTGCVRAGFDRENGAEARDAQAEGGANDLASTSDATADLGLDGGMDVGSDAVTDVGPDAPFSVFGANLLNNGDCADNPANTFPLLWTPGPAPLAGTSWLCSTQGQYQHDGLYLYGGNLGQHNTYLETSIYQDVDVTGYQQAIDGQMAELVYSFYAASYNQEPRDTIELLLEARDGPGGAILGSHTTEQLVTTGTFTLQSGRWVAPAGTRSVRVQLICRKWIAVDCDGYVDDLTLGVEQVSGP